jgi:hypothetical protein
LALQEHGRIPLNSYIENYCGFWRSESGNRMEISLNQDETVSVNFYRAGENIPMLRPWLNDSPAVGMLGTLDPEGGSLDIALSEKENSFCLNLYFDLSDGSYRRVEPSIIRYETEGFLEQYYCFVEPLESYEKY